MEVTTKGTLGRAPRCLRAVPLDFCGPPGAASQSIGIEPGNGREEKVTERQAFIKKDTAR